MYLKHYITLVYVQIFVYLEIQLQIKMKIKMFFFILTLIYLCLKNDLVCFSFMAYQPLKVISCQICFIHIYYIHIYIWFVIIIIIIIMSCRQHSHPWPSLATSPYHSSPPADLQDYILCPHLAAVYTFGLVVLLLLGHMWGSIGVHHLRAHPCFSSSVLRVLFI